MVKRVAGTQGGATFNKGKVAISTEWIVGVAHRSCGLLVKSARE